MRVVELNGGVIAERVERAEVVEVTADQILQRCRGEEIFLPQAQLAALRRGVVGIEKTRDCLRPFAGGRRAGKIASDDAPPVESDWSHAPTTAAAR